MKSNSTKAKNQAQRFIEASREAGCSEDEAVFNENLKRIAKAITQKSKKKGLAN